MFCSHCGKQLADGSAVCPYCGAQLKAAQQQVPFDGNGSPAPDRQPIYTQAPPPPPPQAYPAGDTTNVLAIVGFILAFFIPIAGLVCSILGKKKAAELGGSGQGLATAGVVISSIEIAIYVLAVLVYVIIIIAAIGAAGTMPTY